MRFLNVFFNDEDAEILIYVMFYSLIFEVSEVGRVILEESHESLKVILQRRN